jgi:hypothetical protein
MTDNHVIDPDPDQQAYDICLGCGKVIQLRTDTQQLVTTIGWNPECYGRRP